jgi:integrase
VERAVIRRVSATAIQGESHQTGSDGWQKYTLYVVARFSKPFYATAVRTGEAPRLRLADVDLDYGVVTIRETKFYESRLVPLGSDVVQLLRKYLATPGRWNRHDQPLFQSRQHNPRPI